jgi:hypothetical protein
MKSPHLAATGTPIPIRFAQEDEALLRELKSLTGISISNLIRRAVRYATPRFYDGRINLLTLQEGQFPNQQPKDQQR